MSKHWIHCATLLGTCGLAAIAAMPANAATLGRVEVGTAVTSCQGALPAYEGAIRKRPLAVQNEGGSAAFVSCSFTAITPPTRVLLYVASTSGSEITINCTGVNGFNGGSPAYSAKSISAPANGTTVALDWLPADFGGSATMPAQYFSVSCQLPPGAGITDSYMTYNEEVGS